VRGPDVPVKSLHGHRSDAPRFERLRGSVERRELMALDVELHDVDAFDALGL
jgi:hypothetical protein